MSNAVEIRHVTKVIENDGRKICILNDVSLDVERGTMTAIVGKSGSGKTTLLSIASGIDSPTGGAVKILGQDFYEMKTAQQEKFRNQNIGLLFQNYHLIPELTCEENIRMPLCFSDKNVKEEIIEEWIRRVGLQDKRHFYPQQMSGGEQQRTAILRAIVNDPDIIFADEPTGALDSKTGANVIKFLGAYSRQVGKTIVLVTHDMDIAKRCDRVVEMADGRLAE